MHAKPATRRRHSVELKATVLADCNEPGASVAAVARAHGLNANLVHRWRRQGLGLRALPSAAGVRAPDFGALPVACGPGTAGAAVSSSARVTPQPAADHRSRAGATSAFVPVQLHSRTAVAPAGIRLELQRGAASAIVTWPVDEAAACGRWLREWLG